MVRSQLKESLGMISVLKSQDFVSVDPAELDGENADELDDEYEEDGYSFSSLEGLPNLKQVSAELAPKLFGAYVADLPVRGTATVESIVNVDTDLAPYLVEYARHTEDLKDRDALVEYKDDYEMLAFLCVIAEEANMSLYQLINLPDEDLELLAREVVTPLEEVAPIAAALGAGARVAGAGAARLASAGMSALGRLGAGVASRGAKMARDVIKSPAAKQAAQHAKEKLMGMAKDRALAAGQSAAARIHEKWRARRAAQDEAEESG